MAAAVRARFGQAPTLPAEARAIEPRAWSWPRTPPIRFRNSVAGGRI